MKLTPLDIRKQEFDRSLRGYNPEEVEAFLDMVAEQWEELEGDCRRLEKKVEELENQITHYREIEEALQQALDQTRANAEQTIENAREKAENIVQEAKAEAREIEREAESIIQDAEAKAEEIKRDAKNERDQLKADTQRLQGRRTEVIAQLRALLTSELEILEEYDQKNAPSPSPDDAPEPSLAENPTPPSEPAS